ncbi:hypothetical protein POTOM_013906 [Populus tomentosa]|uniref:Generative cell specific-1/HAP2 domain-containing protein n=1 Tax=Populus tomentosa TaxID=118781 RepID=A0A8X8CYW4_POPTO|nr:hypothetical protein POTOM_013906 [Populus tomentosa]
MAWKEGTPFSTGFTEILNTNLLIELTTDDIGYVYQRIGKAYDPSYRSPGKLSSVTIPTFETLTQFGVATVSAKNFDCSRGVALMELSEVTIRSFKSYPATDKAPRCVCAAILKNSSFNETDPAECQLFTTATILENGSQFAPFRPPKISINGFFGSIEDIWNRIWEGLVDSITGKVCSACAAMDFASERTLRDDDWWEDHLWDDEQRIRDTRRHKKDENGDREVGPRQQHNARKRRSLYQEHRHGHSGRDADYYHHLHHVHKDKSKHRGSKKSNVPQKVYLDGPENSNIGGHHRHRKEGDRGRTV